MLIPKPGDPLLRPSKIAEIFEVSPATVRLWLRDGKLKGVRVNGQWRVQYSEMVRFANAEYGAASDSST